MDIFQIKIDDKSLLTKNRQVVEAILDLIRQEIIVGDQYLPGERTLANALGVKRDVVHRAYKFLQLQELIEYANHRGHRVIKNPKNRLMSLDSDK